VVIASATVSSLDRAAPANPIVGAVLGKGHQVGFANINAKAGHRDQAIRSEEWVDARPHLSRIGWVTVTARWRQPGAVRLDQAARAIISKSLGQEKQKSIGHHIA
jgi:hypothetical protein